MEAMMEETLSRSKLWAGIGVFKGVIGWAWVSLFFKLGVFRG